MMLFFEVSALFLDGALAVPYFAWFAGLYVHIYGYIYWCCLNTLTCFIGEYISISTTRNLLQFRCKEGGELERARVVVGFGREERETRKF